MKTIPEYEPRFIKKEHVSELLNIWHTSKIMFKNRSSRLQWTVVGFIKEHPEYKTTPTYKDLCGLLE